MKWISVFSRNYPRSKHRFSDSVLPLVEWLSQSSLWKPYHEYKSAWLNPVIEEVLLCEQEIGNAQQNTHDVAVRNIIDGDIKTVGRVPRKTDIFTGYMQFDF